VTGEDFVAAVEGFPSAWSAGDSPPGRAEEDGEVVARIRHRHAGAVVDRWTLAGGRIRVELAEPVDAVAPGQGLVLYAGDTVLGGARIVPDDPAGGTGP
jgi:tRNA U34 2-thiouridine synthase MnmA/TrmU